MSEPFDPAWLALREPVDHRSRAGDLLDPLGRWWSARQASTVLDLGCGTGSNLRYLAPRLTGPQRWTVVDNDDALLERVRSPGSTVAIRPLLRDLADLGLTEVKGTDLVTASALLDLVSAAWLDGLVDACAASGCAALFALTYDGTIAWRRGADAMDAEIQRAVNDHQRRDKGLGPALGPEAAHAAAELFRTRGYATWLRPSPWSLGPEDAALSRALIQGWVGAASEARPDSADRLRAWGKRRRGEASEPGFGLVVGHLDLLALPRSMGADRT
jgi:SAM-dependent methyltransferase